MSTQPDGYIQALQTKLIEFLNDYIKLLDESDTILYRTFSVPDATPIPQNIDQKESIDEIHRKIYDVQVLQIRMPIIASMKAGKSTIINAFIGSEFLPARTEVMTALPTAVVLKLGESHTKDTSPVQLILEDETLKALQDLQSNVITILKEKFHDDKELDTLLLSNPHLIQTTKALRDDQQFKLNLRNKLADSEQVQDILTFINELVRISIYLSSRHPTSRLSLDPFLKNIPAILVNYQPVSETQKNLKQQCQLLLIDTPGPNEAAGIAQLPRFVTNELQKADVILAVVEYGHLNTEADAKIADQIKKIRHLKPKQECIYVLINKADLYKRKDMLKDELRQHVATTYDVPIKCVFHLSGSHALIAQKFLADHQKYGDQLNVKTSNTTKDVLEAYCPIDWSDRIEDCELNEVELYAKRLYNKSGISDVLDSVLKTVANQVVRRCIESAIEVCRRMGKSLITDVDIRLNGLKLIEDILHKEIEDLNQDLTDLAEIEKGQLVAVRDISTKLENELKTIFQNKSNECDALVERIFHPDNEKWIDSAEKIRQKKEEKTEFQTTFGATAVGGVAGACVMHSVRPDGDFSIGAILGALLGLTVVQQLFKFLRGTENEIQFTNKEDANEFINGITEMVNKLSTNMYNTIEKQVSDACNQSCKNFYSQISERMTNILHRANDRLNSTFNVNQIIPKKIDLKLKEIHLDVSDIGRIQQHRLTSVFRLIPIQLKESGSTWILSRSKLQEKCVECVKANLERIQIDIVENTNDEMKDNFMSLSNDLQAYLIKYKGYAEICVSDKKLTEENQTKFKTKLQELEERLTKKAQEMEEFTKCIDWEKLV